MIRQIIHINEEKCNGCGLCVSACHEGAIQLENGKAKLIRDDYCDGLGNCLPVCPTGAITFEEREALAYDEAEVQKRMGKAEAAAQPPLPCGCPGTHARALREAADAEAPKAVSPAPVFQSRLNQWPVQIQLVPVNAPSFQGANLLIAADCAAYAHANFHEDFMRKKITLIGCPKLDDVDYSEKLTAILMANDIQSVTVVRMEVPCCGGIEQAVKSALQRSGKMIPWQVVTLSVTGNILD